MEKQENMQSFSWKYDRGEVTMTILEVQRAICSRFSMAESIEIEKAIEHYISRRVDEEVMEKHSELEEENASIRLALEELEESIKDVKKSMEA